MNKSEAYQEMKKGNAVKGEYYTDEEYAFINAEGKIETEEGCVHGGRFDEFWDRIQVEEGWSLYTGVRNPVKPRKKFNIFN